MTDSMTLLKRGAGQILIASLLPVLAEAAPFSLWTEAQETVPPTLLVASAGFPGEALHPLQLAQALVGGGTATGNGWNWTPWGHVRAVADDWRWLPAHDATAWPRRES